MFGDNESVVNSSSKLHAKLHKRHNALSFHRVREAVAAKLVSFNYLPGSSNPADILSKHWSHAHIQDRLRLILFWKGDMPVCSPNRNEFLSVSKKKYMF